MVHLNKSEWQEEEKEEKQNKNVEAICLENIRTNAGK